MSRDQLRNQEAQGGISDFDFTVTKSYFAEIDMSKGDNRLDPVVALHWEGTTNLEGHEILTELDFHPTFTLSKDWATMDGGKTVTNPKAKAKLGGWYGRLGTKIDEIVPVAPGQPDPLDSIDPLTAATWVGTKWHMEELDYDFGKLGPARKLMPTAFLGKGDVPPVATGSSTVTATTSNGSDDSGIRGILTTLAQSASSYSEFQTRALKVDGISKDPKLIEEVLDEGRFYAQARS